VDQVQIQWRTGSHPTGRKNSQVYAPCQWTWQKTIVNSFIISRIDYCNSMLAGAGDFKMATLSLSGMAPAYLAADCQLVSDEDRRQLRSAASRTCVVRRTYSSYADRCFAAACLTLWNSLPAHLRQTDVNFERFKRLLKTSLDSHAYTTA